MQGGSAKQLQKHQDLYRHRQHRVR